MPVVPEPVDPDKPADMPDTMPGQNGGGIRKQYDENGVEIPYQPILGGDPATWSPSSKVD